MSRKESESVEWVEWGTFRAFGEKHGKTEKGRVGAGKDICVIGKKVSKWKEREGHRLTEAMIARVYDRGIDVLVIGIGVHGAIECPNSVVSALETHGISKVLLLRTPEACETYTQLLHQGRRVALLAHGTC